MLDQLIESNGHSAENKRRGGFLFTTFFVVCTIFSSGILWSLFAKDLGMNAGILETSMLVAPLAIAEEKPAAPPETQPKRAKSAAPTADVRTKIIQNINEAPKAAPEKVSVEKNDVPPRNPNNLTVIGPDNLTASNAAAYNSRESSDPKAVGIGNPNGTDGGDDKAVAPAVKPPPPPPPFVKKADVKVPSERKVSLGVINGKAINLVKPAYSPAARAVHADGAVDVQVTIDEKGNVIAANAVSGHQLLRPAAESAARASRFLPTTLSNQPVKVSGVIVYKFSAQ